MTPDEFRTHGKALIDWIADYYEQIEQYPVLSQVAPGAVRAALRAAAHVRPGGQVTGIDLSPLMIATAGEKARARAAGDIEDALAGLQRQQVNGARRPVPQKIIQRGLIIGHGRARRLLFTRPHRIFMFRHMFLHRHLKATAPIKTLNAQLLY